VTIREQENELFKKWWKEKPEIICQFARDGAGKEYESSKIKILYILKETNDANWDCREYLDDGMFYKTTVAKTKNYKGHKKGAPITKTWNGIYKWTKIIFGANEVTDVKNADRVELFSKIAAINLSKIPGKSRTTEEAKEKIKRFVKENQYWLKQQITLYKPDIIICCGIDLVLSQVKKILNLKIDSKNPDKKFIHNNIERKGWYVDIGCKQSLIVDYFHPEATKGGGFEKNLNDKAHLEYLKQIRDAACSC
jgi:hypothetical protein